MANKETGEVFTYESYKPRVKYVMQANEILAAREVGKFIRKEAKKKVHKISETLSKALSYKIKRKLGEIWVGVKDGKGAYYGEMVEKGTSKSAAHPFLLPAIEENRGYIIDLIAKTLHPIDEGTAVSDHFEPGEMTEGEQLLQEVK